MKQKQQDNPTTTDIPNQEPAPDALEFAAAFRAQLPSAMQTTAAGRAAEGIIEVIHSRRLHSGDLLPSESELCANVGCSRSSLREAVRVLSSLDIIEVRHGHGTFVGPMSLDPLVQGLVLRIVLDAERSFDSLLEVMELRRAIDVMSADQVVAGWLGKDTSRLHHLVETMKANYERGDRFTAEDRAFHRELLSVLNNSLMRELSDALWQVHMAVLPLLGLELPADVRKTVDAHEAMYRAVVDNDADSYRELVHTHYEPLQRAVQRAISRA